MHHDDDLHYRRYREEHAKRLDDDYAEWRRRRDAQKAPPQQRAEAHDAGPLESLGRAVGEVVTGPASTEDDQLRH
jgi:hypothetical protein